MYYILYPYKEVREEKLLFFKKHKEGEIDSQYCAVFTF